MIILENYDMISLKKLYLHEFIEIQSIVIKTINVQNSIYNRLDTKYNMLQIKL